MSTQRQQGFSLAIISIIVLALCIAGIIVWRVYDSNQHKQDSQWQASSTNQTTSTATTTDNTQQSAQKTDPNAGYIVIKEWGVRFKPVDGLDGVVYGVGFNKVSSTEEARFSTTQLAEYSNSCGVGTDSQPPLG